MERTYQTLLALLGRALFNGGGALPKEPDWEALWRESRSHAVQLLTYDCLSKEERAAMPPELESQWKEEALSILWKNEQIAAEERAVLSALRQAGIPHVILKGSSSAMCYPRPELRCAGDIDLLVAPERLDAAQAVLEGLNYAPPTELHHCHRTMHRGAFIVELHFEPNGIPQGAAGDVLRQYFQGAEEQTADWNGLPVLPPALRAVLLLMHKLEHILSSGMGLRQLCDWAAFVGQEMTPELWGELDQVLRQAGLLYFAKAITRACTDALSLPVSRAPWCLEASEELTQALLEDILNTGNFGRKENRYGQRLFTDGQTGSRLGSLLRTGVSTCKSHWPVCSKHPILLPVAPIVLVAQYRRRRKEGTRPAFRPLSLYKEAAPRQKLYQALRPYVPEASTPPTGADGKP